MRWIRTLTTLTLTLTVLLGPPLAVFWWLHTTGIRVPSGAQVQDLIADPMTTSTAVAGIVILAALLWMLVAALTVAATWNRVRRTIAWWRQMPLPTPAQATATSMAGAAAFGVPATTLTTPAHPTPPAGTPPTSATAHPDTSPDTGVRKEAAGVDLPDGGWVPADTARAVAAAASVVWIRRRRFYRPTPVSTTPTSDDLQTLPLTVNILHAAVHTDDPDTPPPSGLVQDGPLLIHRFPTGRVALTGPGATAAARGLLITTLYSTPDHDGPPLLVTTTTDLAALLTGTTLDLSDIPGLHIADDLDAALDHLQTANGPTDTTVIAVPTGSPGLPTHRTLLVNTPTNTRLTHRLNAVLAADPSLTAVLWGAAPTDSTHHVDAEGHLRTHTVTPTVGQRVCVLTPRATADLLTLTRHAYTRAPATSSTFPTPNGQGPSGPPGPPRAGTASTAPALQLTVFGPPQLRHAGTLVPVRRSAGLQILVLLALHRHGATAHQLTDALWPGLHPHLVVQRLYTTISELRKTLQQLTGDPVVHRTAEHYRLHPDHIDVDLWHFHDALHHAMTATTAAYRRRALAAMTTIYTGELAADQPWHWIHPHRETQRRHTINAYTELATTSTPTQTAALLQHAITIEPHNDDLRQRAAQAQSAAADDTVRHQ